LEEQNVATVRRLFDAFEAGDIDAALELADPDCELFVPTAERANRGGSYRGHAGIRRYFQDVSRVWEELRIVPQSFRAVGDHVLVTGRVYARGEEGLVVDSPAQWVWRMKGGKAVWGCVYEDREEALKTLGIAGEKED
jgi:ketosteroid isomerase-like protein